MVARPAPERESAGRAHDGRVAWSAPHPLRGANFTRRSTAVVPGRGQCKPASGLSRQRLRSGPSGGQPPTVRLKRARIDFFAWFAGCLTLPGTSTTME